MDWCKLNDIHALQIIPENISGDSGTKGYCSYELNIVTKDASRINVVDHGAIQSIRDDAQTLAEKLGVPVWDTAL